MEIKDKARDENIVIDHLSRLIVGSLYVPLNNAFPDEHLLVISVRQAPWFADIVNYLASRILPHDLSSYQKRKFFHDIRYYFWDEPFLYKLCKDGIYKRCLLEEEIQSVISHCHDSPYRKHASTFKTTAKVFQAGFFWPSLFKGIYAYVRVCDCCQRMGNLSRKNDMPLNFILEVEIFDVWGIDFMGPFPLSRGDKYILVAMDCVFNWVEAVANPTNDSRLWLSYLRGSFFFVLES